MSRKALQDWAELPRSLGDRLSPITWTTATIGSDAVLCELKKWCKNSWTTFLLKILDAPQDLSYLESPFPYGSHAHHFDLLLSLTQLISGYWSSTECETYWCRAFQGHKVHHYQVQGCLQDHNLSLQEWELHLRANWPTSKGHSRLPISNYKDGWCTPSLTSSGSHCWSADTSCNLKNQFSKP